MSNNYQIFWLQSDNVAMQKKFKAEVNELHETLLQVKRDYDLLRMEFEQNLKSTEQTGENISSNLVSAWMWNISRIKR